jgi:hypothetical protein
LEEQNSGVLLQVAKIAIWTAKRNLVNLKWEPVESAKWVVMQGCSRKIFT